MDDAAREMVSAGGDDGEGARDMADARHRRGARGRCGRHSASGDPERGAARPAAAASINMLQYRADQQETTVSGVLARELDGIASTHLEELSAALPGFAEAMAWPGEGC